MKRKMFYMILALMVLGTIVMIFNGSDIIPKIATNNNTAPKEPPKPTQIYNEIEYKMKEPVETKGMIFTIDSATITKKINKELNFKDFVEYISGYPEINGTNSFDDKGNFIDNNNYVWVQVTWENTSDEDNEQYLNCFGLSTIEHTNNSGFMKEPLIISTSTDYTKKNTFAYTLKSKEKITFYLGYIITDQEAQDFKDSMYISLNINGTSYTYNDKDRKGIKLKFD